MGFEAERLPRARDASQLVLQELGDELLVYDQRDHKAHSLDGVAAAVFRRCDGRTTVAEAAEAIAAGGRPADVALVAAALDELRATGLLESPAPRVPALSRRDALRRVGFIAGAAVAIPLVQSIVAPSVAQAASCGDVLQPCCVGNTCNGTNICSAGTCQPGD